MRWKKSGRVALAEMVFHDRERLVLIRPAKGGLVLQVMFYATEVRDFSAIPKAENERLTPEEFELAAGLIEKLSSNAFEPEAYTDEYRERVQAMIEAKVQGREITVSPPAPPRGQVIDMYAALKRSLETARPRTTAGRRRKNA